MNEDSPSNDNHNDVTQYCPDCGYDLYGLPEERCPECGTPFDRSALPLVARSGQGWTLKPSDLALLGLLLYLSALLLLSMLNVEAKSYTWMMVQFVLILIGPPIAAVILLWAVWNVMQTGNRKHIIRTILLTMVMMLMWFMLFASYLQLKREIRIVRQLYYQQMRQQTTNPP